MSTHTRSGSNSHGQGLSPSVDRMPPPTKRHKRLPSVSSKTGASSRQKAVAWNCFEICTDIERSARCKYCGKVYAYHVKETGCSHLNAHVKSCKAYAKARAAEEPSQEVLIRRDGDGSIESVSRFNQEECRKTLAEMIVLDELPLSFVEGQGFRRFCERNIPLFAIPSRRTITRDILQMFFEKKAMFKSTLSDRDQGVSLTTDIWTSIQNTSYMVVTGHFIDQSWQLHRQILSFSPMTNHKGETIGKALETMVRDWGIKRLLTVTVDNASANLVALNYLKRRLLTLKPEALILANDDVMQVRCCCHILNLIVADGLIEMKNSISAIRNAVKYVRSSPARLQSFKQFVKLENIDNSGTVVLDVPTRWNSTYLMLAHALKFQAVFDRMAIEDGLFNTYFIEAEDGQQRVGPPIIEDWANARSFVSFLRKFYDITCKFSSSLSATSNICLGEITKVLIALTKAQTSGDLVLGNMASAMKLKFNKYWDSSRKLNKLLIIALILDPRYKLTFAIRCFSKFCDNDLVQTEEMKRASQDFLMKMFDVYSSLSSQTHEEHGGSTSASGCDMTPSGSSRVDDSVLVTELDGDDLYDEHLAELDVTPGATEIDRYLSDSYEGTRDPKFDVLNWWKYNGVKYPVLARIARDVLAIPVSTVASESAFSTGGRVLDDFRSSLTPTMVEALICCQDWIRDSNRAEKEKVVEKNILETVFYEALDEATPKFARGLVVQSVNGLRGCFWKAVTIE